MLLFEFPLAEIISACSGTIICHKREQNNIIGEILNTGDNVDDQKDFGLTGSYFKITPTDIYNYAKNKFLKTHQEILRVQRNIENNEKQNDERYQKHLIDIKKSDKR